MGASVHETASVLEWTDQRCIRVVAWVFDAVALGAKECMRVCTPGSVPMPAGELAGEVPEHCACESVLIAATAHARTV